MITDFVDLSVRVNQEVAKMRFLVTDLGIEDAILGYPWLARFEPQFGWKEGIIDTNFLPIVMQSLNWEEQTKQTIARIVTEPMTEEEKDRIVEELCKECATTASIATKLAQDANQYTKEVPIPDEYQRHGKVFSEEESHRFPPSRIWDHAIDLKEGAPPNIDCKLIPMTPSEDEALRIFLKEQTDKGYIRESKSPYASAFFFIKKKDGKLCPIQDYRKLNEQTIRNRYPLPLIPDLIAEVQNAWVFTKFDIRWGYNNVRIKEGDEHKAAFKTKYGLFEPRVMFFGLTNSPATFQAMTNEILRDLREKYRPKGVVISGYMDDYLIATSSSIELHRQATHDLLDLIEQHDLFIKPEKCVWEAPRVDYLGLILEKGVVRMDPAKIAGVAEWPVPTTVKQVRSFLGFINYYRPFVPNFSHVARPLNKLTKKGVQFQWGQKEQVAFETLRAKLISEPILRQPQLDRQFKIEVDASGFAIGAVLMQ